MTSSRCGSTRCAPPWTRNGWPAVLVYGDVREHSALAYFSNFIPRVRWAHGAVAAHRRRAAVVRHEHARSAGDADADLDSPTCAPAWARNGKARSIPGSIASKAISAVKLGTLGFDIMAPVLHAAVRRSLGDRFALQRADDIVAIPSPHKRPRELTMMRASCKLLEAAAKTFAESWRSSHEPETAALDAERVARSLAAQDVRTLVSLDGGRTLVPFQGRFEKCRRAAGRLSRRQGFRAIGPTCSSPSMTAPSRRPRGKRRRRSMRSSRRCGRARGSTHSTPKPSARWRRTGFIRSSAAASATASACRCMKVRIPRRTMQRGGRRRLRLAGWCRRRQRRQSFMSAIVRSRRRGRKFWSAPDPGGGE